MHSDCALSMTHRPLQSPRPLLRIQEVKVTLKKLLAGEPPGDSRQWPQTALAVTASFQGFQAMWRHAGL